MSSAEGDDAAQADSPSADNRAGLVELVETEQKSEAASCGDTQTDVPGNVCVREPDHQGPHVGQSDGVYVQWEN